MIFDLLSGLAIYLAGLFFGILIHRPHTGRDRYDRPI